MERKTEREPISNGKYVLIAHERGANLYVLADSETGNMMACNRRMLEEHYQYSESLTSFNTLLGNLWEEVREKARLGVISQKDIDKDVERSVKRIFNWAIQAIGCPPKERVDFFSVPKDVVASINWVPKEQ